MNRPRLSQRFALWLAAAIGWQVHVSVPPPPRCVIIGAPHTSNWDLPFTLLVMAVANVRIRWVGKASLFRGPFAPLMRWLGGIPVERSHSSNFVAQMVAAFDQDTPLCLGILPEGTRSRVNNWKTGFYYIALGAGVPIVLAYCDYRRKVVGFGSEFLYPTGDLQSDFNIIHAFYQNVIGLHPERQGPIQIAIDKENHNDADTAGRD
jgi:1-acyl-sn-glycerol-3-phosphate acyltransferase